MGHVTLWAHLEVVKQVLMTFGLFPLKIISAAPYRHEPISVKK